MFIENLGEDLPALLVSNAVNVSARFGKGTEGRAGLVLVLVILLEDLLRGATPGVPVCNHTFNRDTGI